MSNTKIINNERRDMESLKKYRRKKGVIQKAVAKQLGVSRQTYAKWENNQEEISVGQAKAVCKILGCSVDDIFLEKKVR